MTNNVKMDNNLSFDKIVEIIKKVEFTPELIKEINGSLKQIADDYEKQCWESRITVEWLNKPFSQL